MRPASGEKDGYASSTELEGVAPSRFATRRTRPAPCGRSTPSGRARAAAPSAGSSAAGCRSADDRVDERLNRLVGDLVRQVARGEPVRVAAQPVVDGLVEQEGVEDVGTGAQARPRPSRRPRPAVRRTSRSGEYMRASACSKEISSPSTDAQGAESSWKSRPQAAWPDTDFSVRIRLLRLREEVRAEAAQRAEEVRPALERGSASSSSARSSGTAAHSSCANRSSFSRPALHSCVRCSSAPRVGSAVSVANRRWANTAGAVSDLRSRPAPERLDELLRAEARRSGRGSARGTRDALARPPGPARRRGRPGPRRGR